MGMFKKCSILSVVSFVLRHFSNPFNIVQQYHVHSVGSHQPPVPETNVSSASAPTDIVPSDSTSGEMATLPSALSTNTANGASPATFQLELLNKDGRIGIYLPEARKARIARFHAKRKMRIWRKRIKYDCRKKLADSRPRIKGRFVKRSDVDD